MAMVHRGGRRSVVDEVIQSDRSSCDMKRRLLIRIVIFAAAAVDRCGAVEKRFRPWGLPSSALTLASRRYPAPNKPARLLLDEDDDDDDNDEEHPLALVSRGGSSEEDWYERAARREKDRYYPEGQQPSNEDYYNDGGRGDRRNNGDQQDSNADDDYYGRDEQRRRRNDSSSSGGGLLSSILPSTSLLRGDRKTGLLFLGGGLAITFLGISLFFNRTLLRLGNLMFMAGVPMTLGPSRTLGYFVQPEKLRATACLGLGIFLVFMGSPVFGILLEFFGLLNLFGNMFPVVWMFAKNLPVLGPILKTTSGEGSAKRRKAPRYDDDPSPPAQYEEQDGYADYNDQYYEPPPPSGRQQSYGPDGYDNYNEWDDNLPPGEQQPPSRYY
jgi:Got1/Sft2-like family